VSRSGATRKKQVRGEAKKKEKSRIEAAIAFVYTTFQLSRPGRPRNKLGDFGTIAYHRVLLGIGGHRWGVLLIHRSFFTSYDCLVGKRKAATVNIVCTREAGISHRIRGERVSP